MEKHHRNSDKNRNKKECYFLRNKITYIDYKDVVLLKRFLTDRGKILPRRITGISAGFQRHLSVAVKRARHAGLLPATFTGSSQD
jgi:small subunit ribosomal protein S18